MADKNLKLDEETLKALIRKTIEAAGPMDPATIPHQVKERLKGQATGELDVDAYIREMMARANKGK